MRHSYKEFRNHVFTNEYGKQANFSNNSDYYLCHSWFVYIDWDNVATFGTHSQLTNCQRFFLFIQAIEKLHISIRISVFCFHCGLDLSLDQTWRPLNYFRLLKMDNWNSIQVFVDFKRVYLETVYFPLSNILEVKYAKKLVKMNIECSKH